MLAPPSPAITRLRVCDRRVKLLTAKDTLLEQQNEQMVQLT